MADDAAVLIIDDDEAVRGAFRRVLQGAGLTTAVSAARLPSCSVKPLGSKKSRLFSDSTPTRRCPMTSRSCSRAGEEDHA